MKKFVASMAVMGLLMSFGATSSFAAAGEDHLHYGEQLAKGQHLVSKNGLYSLEMQYDGNLVLYGRGTHLWDTHTGGNTHVMGAIFSNRLFLAGDNGYSQWTSDNWNGESGNLLLLQDDGNLVIYVNYFDYYRAVWDTGTNL